ASVASAAADWSATLSSDPLMPRTLNASALLRTITRVAASPTFTSALAVVSDDTTIGTGTLTVTGIRIFSTALLFVCRNTSAVQFPAGQSGASVAVTSNVTS